MSRIWVSHVTLYQWVMSHIYIRISDMTHRYVFTWLIDTTHRNTLQHTATYCNTLQHTFVYLTWLIDTYLPQAKPWCRTQADYPYMCHDSFIYVTWLTHIRDMTHPYMWHNSFIYIYKEPRLCVELWLIIHTCVMTHSYMSRDSFIYVTWLIRICDITLSYMCDVAHSYVRDMAGSYVWRGSFTCVAWLVHMCDVAHPYVWRGSFICVRHDPSMCIRMYICDIYLQRATPPCRTLADYPATLASRCVIRSRLCCSCLPSWYEWDTSNLWIRHIARMNESCRVYALAFHCVIRSRLCCSCLPFWFEWVTSKMSHVARMNESHHTCEWVMSHVWMSHVAYMHLHLAVKLVHACAALACHHDMNESYQHMWMSHVTRMNESCHIHALASRCIILSRVCCSCLPSWYKRVISLIWMRDIARMNESCRHVMSCVYTLASHCHSFVLMLLLLCHPWINESYDWYMNKSYCTYEWVTSHIWMSHVTHMNESCHTYEW